MNCDPKEACGFLIIPQLKRIGMIKSHLELLNVLKRGGQVFPKKITEYLDIFRFCFFLRKIQETLIIIWFLDGHKLAWHKDRVDA